MKKHIIHYICGELNQAQKAEFFERLSLDAEAQEEFVKMQNAVALIGLSAVEGDEEAAEKYLNTFKKNLRRKKLQTSLFSFSKYAASVIIAVCITFLFKTNYLKNEKQSYNHLTVPAGQRVKFTLNDGTTVWLNSLSTLSYPGTFTGNTREVILDGEAYFDVAHDRKKAFIVRTKQFDIRVFGTEFNVLAYAGNPLSEVALLKGSVEVKPAGNSRPYKMSENEKVSFLNNRMTVANHSADAKDEDSECDLTKKNELRKIETDNSKLSVSTIKNYDYFKWREGLICFDNETFEHIMKKTELYYDIRIDVQNTELLKYRYSGKCRAIDGVEQVIKVLQHELQFEYKRDMENNTITIK